MKRMIIAICFLLSASMLSIFGYFKTKSLVIEMTEMLDDIIYYIDDNDFEAIKSLSNEVIKKWQKSQRFLSILLKHDLTIEISSMINFLSDSVVSEDEEETLECINELHSTLIALLNSEKPTIYNVF